MPEFLSLLETEVGKAVIAKFASVAGMAPSAMKHIIKTEASFAEHFVQVVRQVVAELKAEAEGALA